MKTGRRKKPGIETPWSKWPHLKHHHNTTEPFHHQQTDQVIDEAHHHQAALLRPGGEELEEAEPDADEGEEDVDGRESAGGFEDELEEIVNELGEDGGDDGGADEDPGKAGEGGEGDGEVDAGADEGEGPRGRGHNFSSQPLLSISQCLKVLQPKLISKMLLFQSVLQKASAVLKLRSLIKRTLHCGNMKYDALF